MRITETLLFYLVVGVAVSVAMYAAEGIRTPRRIGFLVATSLLFWPLYLPVLLSARSSRTTEPVAPSPSLDAMATAIAQVELELQGALSSLDGWPEATLAREKGRMGELRTALTAQATRIREMDVLLSRTTPEPPNLQSAADLLDAAALERWQKSKRAREQNLSRLAIVRRQTHADLMATLAWIRELVSMIHLAKFTGAPASRTEELVAQIAAAVEGVSLVGCPEPDDLPSELGQIAVET
jgi:hypothetical protein